MSAPAIPRRELIAGGLLLAAAGAASLRAGERAGDAMNTEALALPRRVGPYRFVAATGLVLPPEDETSRRIYDRVLTGCYAMPGAPLVMALVAYGAAQDAALGLHRPDACYPAAGYRVDPAIRVPLTGIAPGHGASFVTARLDGVAEQVYFWTRIGDRFPLTGWQEKRAVIGDALSGAPSDGVLVRLSTVSDDRTGTLGQLAAFNAMLVGALGPAGRALLLGRGGA